MTIKEHIQDQRNVYFEHSCVLPQRKMESGKLQHFSNLAVKEVQAETNDGQAGLANPDSQLGKGS